MPPRITNKGFQSIGDVYAEDEAIDAGYVDPEIQAGVAALLADLTAGEPVDRGPRTITLGDEDWAADYYDAEAVDAQERASFRDAFLAGEPVGTAYDPFSETDPERYEQALQDAIEWERERDEEDERIANRMAVAEARPSSGHQFLKNYLKSLLPDDDTLTFSNIVVPITVGGEPDLKGALRINIFPRVKEDDRKHPYYEEAMLYQREQARRDTMPPAMDLGGTEGVDFATRLRESFLNR